MSNNYTLKAVNEFKCVGADCESNCCRRDWHVEIDPETLARWNRLDNNSFKARLLKQVNNKINDGQNFMSIPFNENNICHYLDNQSQCSIHTDLGSEYLPKTCREYPREFFQSKTISINSANMSCPEIARLVVKNIDENIFTANNISDENLGQVGDGENALENYLDRWTQLVLRDKNSPLSLKLYYIGKAISDFNSLSEKGGLDEKSVIEICEPYQEHLKVLVNAENENKLIVDPVSAGWFWDISYSFSHEIYNALLDYYSLIDPIAPLELPTQKRSRENYESVYSEIRKLLAEARPLINNLKPELLAYLKTLFINMGFPWNPIGGNFLASYIKSVFHFTTTWYLLALVARAKGSLDTEDLTRVIYHVERDYFDKPKLANTMKNNTALFNIENYLSCLFDLK